MQNVIRFGRARTPESSDLVGRYQLLLLVLTVC